MGASQNLTAIKPAIPTPTRKRVFFSAARYLTGKILTILATIFLGVFITILIVNYPGGVGSAPGVSPFEARLERQIALVIDISVNNGIIHRDALGFPDKTAYL
jgi:hypothetical protein